MRLLILAAVFSLFGTAEANPRQIERRVQISTHVFSDRMKSRDFIPQDILDAAQCVAATRNVKAGFLIGGESSTGLVSCRVGSEWSQPSFININGAKIGLLVGGQVSDNVLVFLTDRARRLLNGTQIRVGVDVSFAAGPVGTGRGSMGIPKVDVLVYSAGVGLYAGFSLDGTVISHGPARNAEVYGRGVSGATIIATEGSKAPTVMKQFIDELDRYAP